MVFNVCTTASFALNKCLVMCDPSIMIMVSYMYEKRENELSNDVYIFEKNNS